jgi:hypothetical protein
VHQSTWYCTNQSSCNWAVILSAGLAGSDAEDVASLLRSSWRVMQIDFNTRRIPDMFSLRMQV